jgi:hypothetical protein
MTVPYPYIAGNSLDWTHLGMDALDLASYSQALVKGLHIHVYCTPNHGPLP